MKKRVYFIDEVFGSAPGFIDEYSERFPKEVGLPFDVLYHPSRESKDNRKTR